MEKSDEIIKLKVVTHYDEDDKEFCEDYYCIEVFDGKKKIKYFGDSYHDSGEYRLEGFIEGIEWATSKKVKIVNEEVADGYTG